MLIVMPWLEAMIGEMFDRALKPYEFVQWTDKQETADGCCRFYFEYAEDGVTGLQAAWVTVDFCKGSICLYTRHNVIGEIHKLSVAI